MESLAWSEVDLAQTLHPDAFESAERAAAAAVAAGLGDIAGLESIASCATADLRPVPASPGGLSGLGGLALESILDSGTLKLKDGDQLTQAGLHLDHDGPKDRSSLSDSNPGYDDSSGFQHDHRSTLSRSSWAGTGMSMPSNAEIREYMEKHNVQAFLTDMVAYLVRRMPPEPLDFFVENASAIVAAHREQGVRSNKELPMTPLMQQPPIEEFTVEQQDSVVKHILTVLQHADLARASADKLFRQFARGTGGMAKSEFQELLTFFEGSWGFRRADTAFIVEAMKRWRFRANAANGTQGLPLWPLAQEDFAAAYPGLLRAVRDRYAPMGGRVSRSLFIRQSMGSLERKYSIGPRLGRGAYGEVFLVTCNVTQEQRVCKRVKQQQQRVSTEELVDEVNLLRSLDHPHVVRIFEYFETDESIEMIMEPAFGGTLAGLIEGVFYDDAGNCLQSRPPALTETWVATVIRQLLGALTHAHDVVGLIHRDLKCANVLLVGRPNLSPEEVLQQPIHAMLADFGIAEVFNPESMVADPAVPTSPSRRRLVTQKRGACGWRLQCSRPGGTLQYMSPEVFGGAFTEKCDIWSLGVVMFHLMAGVLPYRGANMLMQVNLVCNPRIHPDWELLTRYGWSLGARLLCQQMLNKDKGLRPSATEAVRDDWLLATRMTSEQALPSPAEVQSLQHQHLQSHLMKMVRHCITSQIGIPSLHHLYQLFQHYDTEGDGMLSYLEIRKALEAVGITKGEDLDLVIESLDGDRNGRIEYSEFIAGCLDLASRDVRRHLRVVFDVFDLDGSGAISTEELRQILMQGANPASDTLQPGEDAQPSGLGPRVLPDGKTVEEIMADMDMNNTGMVEFEELERYLLSEYEASGKRLASAISE